MKTEIVVTAEPRDTRGKNEARRLRARGLAPAVVYGAGTDPVALSVNPKEVNKILRGATGSNTIFNITVNGAEAPGHDRGLAVRSDQEQPAAHRPEAHRHDAAHHRQGAGAPRRACRAA